MRRLARGIPSEQLTQNNTLKPVWIRDGHGTFALPPESFEAVRQGYACGNCLRYFGGVFMSHCPDCGDPTGGYQVVPQWWTTQSAI